MNTYVLPRVIALAQLAATDPGSESARQAASDLTDVLLVIGHDPDKVLSDVAELIDEVSADQADWVRLYREDAARISRRFS